MLARVLVDARLDHLVIQVVPLTGALANAGEHGVATVRLGDVVDELHDENGLADAGAAEQADLAALGVWREQVDDLDARDEDLRFRRLLDVLGSRLVNGTGLDAYDRARLVHGLADHVHDAAESGLADWDGDRATGVGDLLAADQAVGRVHGDGADRVLTQMLGDLEHEAVAVILRFQRVEDVGQLVLELHVDDGAHHLADATHFVASHWHSLCVRRFQSALTRSRRCSIVEIPSFSLSMLI